VAAENKHEEQTEVFGIAFVDILACTTCGLVFIVIILSRMMLLPRSPGDDGDAAQRIRSVRATPQGLWVGDMGIEVPAGELEAGGGAFREWLGTLNPKLDWVGFHVDLGGAEAFREGARICGECNIQWMRVDEGELQRKIIVCRKNKIIISSTGQTIPQAQIADLNGQFWAWLGKLHTDKHFILFEIHSDGHDSFRVASTQLDLAGFVTRVSIQ